MEITDKAILAALDHDTRGHRLLSTASLVYEGVRFHECAHCGSVVDDIYSHVRERHASVVTECPVCKDMFENPGRQSVLCSSCGFQFELDEHGHFPGFTVSCPHCEKAFAAMEVGPVECPHCSQFVIVDVDLLTASGAAVTDDNPPPAIKHLDFELLPPGTWNIEDIVNHYRRLAQNPPLDMRGKGIDWKRIREIERLKPVECYVGKKMWDGYAVFTFGFTGRVVLECPVEGNAVYVLDKHWKSAVRKTKQEVRDQYDPVKVVHKGEWLDRVRNALECDE